MRFVLISVLLLPAILSLVEAGQIRDRLYARSSPLWRFANSRDGLKRNTHTNKHEAINGTRWAVLIAGSNGYENYRHQADVCHAYQLLKKGGLKDENIVVFMYDDVAYDDENPRRGIIINRPNGPDVYKGVPKDYTGENVTVENFIAAVLGNRSAISGGSGKVVDSGPDDHIFIYFSDHGGPGILGMPNEAGLPAEDLVATLKMKHASKSYKELVIYVEACESGSIFEGANLEYLNIYATTAANAEESSYATYCPDEGLKSKVEYNTCLGDLYSVNWLEDAEAEDRKRETFHDEYEIVRNETLDPASGWSGSHVIEFGDKNVGKDHLAVFMGTSGGRGRGSLSENSIISADKPAQRGRVNQRDADLMHFWHKFINAPEDSERKLKAQEQLLNVLSHRLHIDKSIEMIGNLLFGIQNGSQTMKAIRPSGQVLVDDWNCLKTIAGTFETHCGALAQYGLKHMRSMANICNAGISKERMAEAAAKVCPQFPSNPLSSLKRGFSV